MKKYIVAIRFNSDQEVATRCKVDCLSEEWIKKRLEIFNLCTRKSLEMQTNQDFMAVVAIHPSSEEIVKKLLKAYPTLPANIVFTSNRNKVIEGYIRGADKVFVSSLDSDDMYAPEFMQYLHDYHEREDETLIIFTKGYVYNLYTHIIDEYESPSPPFYTQIFKVKEYLDYYRYYHLIRHWYMQRFKHTAISKPLYMIILHDKNSYGNYKNIAPRVFGTEQVLSNWKSVKQQYHLQ